VEQGAAPGAINSSRVENGKTVRTRPLCAYPGIARYNGRGGINQAESFTCAKP